MITDCRVGLQVLCTNHPWLTEIPAPNGGSGSDITHGGLDVLVKPTGRDTRTAMTSSPIKTSDNRETIELAAI